MFYPQLCDSFAIKKTPMFMGTKRDLKCDPKVYHLFLALSATCPSNNTLPLGFFEGGLLKQGRILGLRASRAGLIFLRDQKGGGR